MTRAEAKKKAEIMQAYAEGKEIQWLRGAEWVDVENPGFGANADNYRIKLEPHYRPFKSAEEVMEAIKEHGDWVIRDIYFDKIVSLTHNSVNTMGTNISYNIAFTKYTFLDGTPFGKLEEE